MLRTASLQDADPSNHVAERHCETGQAVSKHVGIVCSVHSPALSLQSGKYQSSSMQQNWFRTSIASCRSSAFTRLQHIAISELKPPDMREQLWTARCRPCACCRMCMLSTLSRLCINRPISACSCSRGGRPQRGPGALEQAERRREALRQPRARILCRLRRHCAGEPGLALPERGPGPRGELEAHSTSQHASQSTCVTSAVQSKRHVWLPLAAADPSALSTSNQLTGCPIFNAGARLLRLPDRHREHPLRCARLRWC